MNLTCHEPLDFPTKTLKGNECLNWKKYIYIKTIDQYGFNVQHLRDEENLKARIFNTIRLYNMHTKLRHILTVASVFVFLKTRRF